jgi:hypothetical protein
MPDRSPVPAGRGGGRRLSPAPVVCDYQHASEDGRRPPRPPRCWPAHRASATSLANSAPPAAGSPAPLAPSRSAI